MTIIKSLPPLHPDEELELELVIRTRVNKQALIEAIDFQREKSGLSKKCGAHLFLEALKQMDENVNFGRLFAEIIYDFDEDGAQLIDGVITEIGLRDV